MELTVELRIKLAIRVEDGIVELEIKLRMKLMNQVEVIFRDGNKGLR
jgi:hypothetical protein